MAAGPEQLDIAGQLLALPRPGHDRGTRPRDPLRIVGMQIDRRAIERLAPVGNGSIIVRMRDSDRLQSAERADMLDRLSRGERNAIPHHASVRLAQDERALADGKRRLEAYSGDAEILAPDQLV